MSSVGTGKPGGRLDLEIANLGLRLVGDPQVLQAAASRWGNFVRDDAGGASPDLEIVVTVDPADPPRPGRWTTTPVVIEPIDRPDRPRRYQGETFAGELDPAGRSASVTLPGIPGGLDAFLRICLSVLLGRTGGLLLHAAGVVSAQRAVAFCGPSGAGKSTCVGVAGSRRVLSDELLAVAPSPEGYVAYATPFRPPEGRPGGREHARLAALLHLERGVQPELERLDHAQAVARLLKVIWFVSAGPEESEEIWSVAERMLTELPSYALAKDRGPSFWHMVDPLFRSELSHVV